VCALFIIPFFPIESFGWNFKWGTHAWVVKGGPHSWVWVVIRPHLVIFSYWVLYFWLKSNNWEATIRVYHILGTPLECLGPITKLEGLFENT
jgi:hypothetical protein